METKVTEATAELRLMEITEPASVSKEENEQAGQLHRYLQERAKQQSHQCFMVFEVVKQELPTFQLRRYADVSNGIICMVFQDSREKGVDLWLDVYCPRQIDPSTPFSPGLYNVFCTQLALLDARVSLEQVADAIRKAKRVRDMK